MKCLNFVKDTMQIAGNLAKPKGSAVRLVISTLLLVAAASASARAADPCTPSLNEQGQPAAVNGWVYSFGLTIDYEHDKVVSYGNCSSHQLLSDRPKGSQPFAIYAPDWQGLKESPDPSMPIDCDSLWAACRAGGDPSSGACGAYRRGCTATV